MREIGLYMLFSVQRCKGLRYRKFCEVFSQYCGHPTVL